jgi:alpha-beta hydrolase superfamily lysophospholipase
VARHRAARESAVLIVSTALADARYVERLSYMTLKLSVETADELVDTPVTWWVSGVPAGSVVRLEVEGTDAAGRCWASEGEYPVDEQGRLTIEDPDEPWAGMVMTEPPGPAVVFTAPDDVWTCTATVTSGDARDQATVRRVYRSGPPPEEIAGDRWRLTVFRPGTAVGGATAVLLVPGTTGVAAMTPTAALLASRGHPTAVLGYLQAPGLPDAMHSIPVEVVGEALDAFGALEVVDRERVAVWAVSVGTGLALSALAGPGKTLVCGVVVESPTDVVQQALAEGGRPPQASSLSRDGADLPYAPMHGERLLGQVLSHAVLRRLPGPARSTAMRLHPAYDRTKDDPSAVRAATISVEDIAAPLLVVAGTADAMWPSETMARAIAARRRAHGVDSRDQLVVLPDTGHFVRPPATPSTADRNADLVSGGTPHGNATGWRTAWGAALAFLHDLPPGR